MRFKPRFSFWVMHLVWTLYVVNAALRFHRGDRLTAGLYACCAVFGLLAVLKYPLPQWCELRQNDLFVRSGWRENIIAYEQIVSIRTGSGMWIELRTREGKRFRLPIAEQDRFRAEISDRCPHLEPKPFGVLAMPLLPTLPS